MRVAAVVMLLMAAPAAWAQAGPGGGGRHGGGGAHRGGRAAPAASLPELHATEVWPRLDPGAVLCQSRDELAMRARLLEDAPPGQADMPAGCRLVHQMVAVTVVDRAPPAATEVKLQDSQETGWTDAYLPARTP